MFDLTPYRLPLDPMPAAARAVRDRGVLRTELPGPERARALWLEGGEPYPDGVRRAPDGTALVTCTTALPGVTPAMIDWWFGWHLPESERYQLWHPLAHRKARVKHDRSSLADDRARYVGNVSYVDEYIGSALHRLAIEFQTPESFGLTGIDVLGGTAVCARTVDRALTSEGGCVVHVVLPSAGGSVMRSGFWLGRIQSRLPLVAGLVTRLANRPGVRRRFIGDGFLLDLFQHCSEEMNHLAKFLPRLHADVQRRGG